MASDSEDVIDFGENKVLRSQKHINIEPGNHSYDLISEAEYDLVYAVNGQGTVTWNNEAHELHAGSKVTIERDAPYIVKSASNDGLTVIIYSVATEYN